MRWADLQVVELPYRKKKHEKWLLPGIRGLQAADGTIWGGAVDCNNERGADDYEKAIICNRTLYIYDSSDGRVRGFRKGRG